MLKLSNRIFIVFCSFVVTITLLSYFTSDLNGIHSSGLAITLNTISLALYIGIGVTNWLVSKLGQNPPLDISGIQWTGVGVAWVCTWLVMIYGTL